MGDTATWTGGVPVTTNLLTQPLPADKCVVLKANREWGMVDCEEPKFFVCVRGAQTKFVFVEIPTPMVALRGQYHPPFSSINLNNFSIKYTSRIIAMQCAAQLFSLLSSINN